MYHFRVEVLGADQLSVVLDGSSLVLLGQAIRTGGKRRVLSDLAIRPGDVAELLSEPGVLRHAKAATAFR